MRKTVTCNLGRILKRVGLDVVDLEKVTGLSSSSIINYCKGQPPTLRNASRISAAVGCNIEDIWPWVFRKQEPVTRESQEPAEVGM